METEARYYRPYYASDSEEESDLSSDDLSYESIRIPRPPNAEEEEVDLPDFAEFARSLHAPVMLASGPTFATDTSQLAYGMNDLRKDIVYGPALPDVSGSTLTIATNNTDNVIILESINRDFEIYPQPTQCQLMLPREYRFISNFEIVQISFNSAFFYFTQDKYNIKIQIVEQGRSEYAYTLNPTTSIPLVLTNSIRPGSYILPDLLNELMTQLNTPPLFFDFVNGYNDFAIIFQSTGDYSLNFNYPGDYYYDSIHQTYVANPTRELICSFYFKTRFAVTGTLGGYTTDQMLVAYYYPVLKEYLIDPTTSPAEYAPYISSVQLQYILYNFEGLLDKTVIGLCKIPPFKAILDVYRIKHTFRYTLINQYVCTYNPTNNIICIESSGLNNSLVALLNAQFTTILATATTQFPQFNYTNVTGTVNTLHAILAGMYELIQTSMSLIFGAPYGEYALTYYIDFNNELLLRKGLYIKNPILNNNSSPPVNTLTDILTKFQIPSVTYWKNMVNVGSFNMTSLNGINHPFQMDTLEYIGNKPFIDSTGIIYTDSAEQSGDILIHVPAGKYAVFQFTSKYRQTMQVELLPKPASLQYPEWNAANLTVNNSIFNLPYSTILPNGSVSLIQTSTRAINPIDITNLFDYDPISYYSTMNTSTYDLSITGVDRNGVVYAYTAPMPQGVTSTTVKVKYTLNMAILPGITKLTDSPLVYNSTISYNLRDTFLYGGTEYICVEQPFPPLPADPTTTTFFTPLSPTIQINVNASNAIEYDETSLQQTFTDDFVVFIYHSQAGLYADISPAGLLNENPFFYKYSYTIPAGSSILNFSYMAYAGETYYMLIRPQNNIFTRIPFRILPYVSTGLQTSVIQELNTQLAPPTDPAYFDPTSPTFDYTKYLSTSFVIAKVHDPDWIQLPIHISTLSPDTSDINIAISTIQPLLGYDSKYVSNDATDYIPATLGVSTILIDPITSYRFIKASQYDPVAQSYTQTGTKNFITTNTNVQYTTGTVSPSYKLCNYNATAYISTTGALTNIPSYTSAATSGPLKGYSYDGQGNLLLGTGACGFTFLPADGTWTTDTITFKGQTTTTAVNVLGIFPTNMIYQQTPSTIISMLPNAAAIAVFSTMTTYTNATLNQGFDSTLGTYYTYSTIRTNATLRGLVQPPSVSVPDLRSHYSIIAFEVIGVGLGALHTYADVIAQTNFSIVPFENLAGSPIPYPHGYNAVTSGVFYDGVSSINQREMVIAGAQTSTAPALLPNTALYHDKSVYAYEQSIPIVNTHLHFLNPVDSIITGMNAMVRWTGFPVQATNIIATVPGYLLLQGNMYGIVYYSQTSTQVTTSTVLTDDLVFPPSENTILLSIAGNNTSYAFLGFNFITNKLCIKVYNPITNILTNVPSTSTQPYDPVAHRIGDFVFSNTQSWWITYTIVSTGQAMMYGFTDSAVEVLYPLTTGRGYLAMDPASSTVFYASGSNGFSTVYQCTSAVGPSITNAAIAIAGYNVTTFIQMSAYGDSVYLIDGIQPGFFIWDPTTPNAYQTSQVLPAIPMSIGVGPIHSVWVCFSTSPFVMAHAFNKTVFDIACQVFIPTMKIGLKVVTPMYTSIRNLSQLSASEWQHSAMFVYSTFNSFSNDILANGGKWGLESNYMVCDTSFRGYDYNAYLQNIPVASNWSPTPLTSNAPNAYYLAVRGFTPTEDFNAILRWKVPNKSDYGYMPISTIMDEVPVLTNPTYPKIFNPSYITALSTFNPKFIGIQVYGLSVASGLPGSTIQTYGFADFLQKYSTIYSTYESYQLYLSTVNNSVTANMINYTTSNLQYILPASAVTRTRFTDPIPFSLQWSTLTAATPPAIGTEVSEWGLGWNLGYSKSDTPYDIVHFADSLFKIQDDYIYLRLNPEFNINRLASGSKENYSDSREPSGITDQYYGKLLLNGFGNKATTFTHSPVIFNPTLSRLSKLNFEWLDARGNVLSSASATNSEWSMTINIQEQIKYFDFGSLAPALSTLKPVSE